MVSQSHRDLALRFDTKYHFKVTSTSLRHEARADIDHFADRVAITAEGAARTLILKRSGDLILVSFAKADDGSDTDSDSLEMPILKDKPFFVSYDALKKRYRLTQPG